MHHATAVPASGAGYALASSVFNPTLRGIGKYCLNMRYEPEPAVLPPLWWAGSQRPAGQPSKTGVTAL